jgi:hypothetical protein
MLSKRIQQMIMGGRKIARDHGAMEDAQKENSKKQ